MAKRRILVEEISESALKKVAQILGPCSAAQLALDDAATRRARGETVAFYQRGDTLLVGPPAEPRDLPDAELERVQGPGR